MVLTARDLRVSVYADGAQRSVLSGASLELAAGDLLELGGSSGAGKSTLLRSLARLQPGMSGDLFLAGEPASAIAPADWRCRVALVPQQACALPGTVAENLRAPWTLRIRAGTPGPDDTALRSALDSVGLDDVSLERDALRLSVGQASRVAFLRVWLTHPEVLLLDEPDAALDDVAAGAIERATQDFARAGGAVIRVRHARTTDPGNRRVTLCDGVLTESFPEDPQ